MNLIKNVLTDVISRVGVLWASLVRTYVPMGLGALFGWLASQGITLPSWLTDQSETTLIVFGMIAWYALARVLEVQGANRRWSWMVLVGGIMNGLPKPPEYTPTVVTAAEPYTSPVTGAIMTRVTTSDGSEQHFVAP